MRNRTQKSSGRAICPNGLGVLAVLAGTLVLAACQHDGRTTPAVSLDEAKQITSTFSGSFTPPPKSVNDVLIAVSEGRLRPRSCEANPTLSDEEVREMMLSLPGFKPGRCGRVSFAESQAEREFERGNYAKSIKYMKWAIGSMPDRYRGGLAGRSAKLATYYAYARNFDAADRAISEARGYAAGLRPDEWGVPKWAAWFRFHINEGQAAIAESRGDLTRAEAYYRRAIDAIETFRFGGNRYEYASLALARNLMQQGRLVEAENGVRDVMRYRIEYEVMSPLVGAGLVRLSEVLYEQGRFEDAESVARAAVRIYRAICAAPENLFLTTARNVLGKSLVAQGRWQEALAEYETLRAGMAADPESFERMFAGNLYRALALLRAGRTAEAGEKLEIAFERTKARLGEKHYKTAEIRGFLAMAQLAAGNRERALEEFAAATAILLKRSREADDDGATFKARDRRLALILGAYIGLLADIDGTALARESGLDAPSVAFRLAEAARTRSVQRALSASGARAALTDPALADLARREQDTQKQIAALYGTLASELSRPYSEQNGGMIRDLRVKVDRLRGARAALMEEIEARFPDYADLVNPKPATIAEARAALRPGEALISTYVGEDRTFVWAIPHRGEAAFAAAPLGRERIVAAVRQLRQALEPAATTLGEIPAYDTALAHKLYASLLEPVDAGWSGADSLLVVAHGALGQLPFSLLVTAPTKLGAEREPLFANYREVSWLARSHAVTVLPSVGSLAALRALPPGNPNRRAFAGFGDPWFSAAQAAEAAAPVPAAVVASRGALAIRGMPIRLRSLPKMEEFDSADLALLPRLPDTAVEVRGIAMALNADLTADVFVGAAANEGAVKTMDLSDRRVIAFATHGLVPGDLDGLTQPALALSAPDVAGGGGVGLLTMGEILGLRLDADWVVLSACNTAAGQGAGAEAVSGLGRAFFYAGARALLVSNWPVETTSAKALTTDIFRRQAENPMLSRAQALRQAMLALIDGPGHVDGAGRSVFSYAHPIFWAPFSLIGDGGHAAARS